MEKALGEFGDHLDEPEPKLATLLRILANETREGLRFAGSSCPSFIEEPGTIRSIVGIQGALEEGPKEAGKVEG